MLGSHTPSPPGSKFGCAVLKVKTAYPKKSDILCRGHRGRIEQGFLLQIRPAAAKLDASVCGELIEPGSGHGLCEVVGTVAVGLLLDDANGLASDLLLQPEKPCCYVPHTSNSATRSQTLGGAAVGG